MTNTQLFIAANTIWVVQNGETHGSPVNPLLRRSGKTNVGVAPAGKARLRRQSPADPPSEGAVL